MDITAGDYAGEKGKGMRDALIPVPEEEYPYSNLDDQLDPSGDQLCKRESSNCFYQKNSPTNKSVTSPSIVDSNVLQNNHQQPYFQYSGEETSMIRFTEHQSLLQTGHFNNDERNGPNLLASMRGSSDREISVQLISDPALARQKTSTNVANDSVANIRAAHQAL